MCTGGGASGFYAGSGAAAGGSRRIDLYFDGRAAGIDSGAAGRIAGICNSVGALGTQECAGNVVDGAADDAGIFWGRAFDAAAGRNFPGYKFLGDECTAGKGVAEGGGVR